MNKITVELYRYVEKCLKCYNLDYVKDGDYFKINSRFGKWRVRPEHVNRSKIVTIYTRFENPEKVNQTIFKNFSFNSFSGKLNLHYFNKDKDFLLNNFDVLCKLVCE